MPDEHAQPEKCKGCQKDKVFHDVTIGPEGSIVEKHACEDCAAEQGFVPTPSAATPLHQLLSTFVSSGGAPVAPSAGGVEITVRARACESCGTTFSDFKRSGLLGCAGCYRAFEGQLGPMIERAHEGATHHVGKVPKRALSECGMGPDPARLERLLGDAEARSARMAAIRGQIQQALEREEYERAAELRDALRRLGGRADDAPGAQA